MAFTETLLFTLDDVRSVRKVSVNINDFDIYAIEAQRNYLSKILGGGLYYALIKSPEDARFEPLLNGTNYIDGAMTVLFRGCKRYLSYVWLYLYSIGSPIQETPIGAMMFKDEYAEHAESMKMGSEMRKHYIKSADGLEETILRYLDKNRVAFPEFNESNQIKQASRDNMTLKTFGKAYKPPNNFIL